MGRPISGGWGALPLLLAALLSPRVIALDVTRSPDVTRPEVSDFRVVNYEALVHNVDTFTETGVQHFTQIHFDVKRYQVGPVR